MTTDLLLPELGENITSGVVVKVLVQVGDTVEVGQPVVEIETDKAVVEVPADAAGVVAQVYVSEGDEITVGQKILSVEADAAPLRPDPIAQPSSVPAEPPGGTPLPLSPPLWPNRQAHPTTRPNPRTPRSEPRPRGRAAKTSPAAQDRARGTARGGRPCPAARENRRTVRKARRRARTPGHP